MSEGDNSAELHVIFGSGPVGLAVTDELESGELATVRVRGFGVRRSFHLVTRREALLSPAARAFREVATSS